MIQKATTPDAAKRDIWLLDIIDVASPCPAEWDKMQGTDKARLCVQCEKNVYNLSGMTRPEAETLIREKDGKACIRFYRRADGKIITTDCPVGLRALRRQAARLVAGIATLLAVLSCGSLLARSRPFDEECDSVRVHAGPVQRLIDWLDPPMQAIGGFGSFLPKPPGPDTVKQDDS